MSKWTCRESYYNLWGVRVGIRAMVRSWLRKPVAWLRRRLGIDEADRKWEESDERIRDLYD